MAIAALRHHRRLVAATAVLAVTLVACDDDAPAADDRTDAPADDASDGETPPDEGEAPIEEPAEDGAADDGTAAEEPATPPAVSEVTIEALDAPESIAEVRVGEIIVEFEGEVTDEGTVLTLEEPILFDFDSSTLRSGADEAIGDIAEVLAFYDEAPVEVIGHTDDVGDAAYNEELSTDRARAVFDGLVESGITEDRMSSEGRGFDDPAVPNDSDENRAINRRVEVLIVGVTPPDQDG